MNYMQNEVALNQADVGLPLANKSLIVEMRDYLLNPLDDRLL